VGLGVVCTGSLGSLPPPQTQHMSLLKKSLSSYLPHPVGWSSYQAQSSPQGSVAPLLESTHSSVTTVGGKVVIATVGVSVTTGVGGLVVVATVGLSVAKVGGTVVAMEGLGVAMEGVSVTVGVGVARVGFIVGI